MRERESWRFRSIMVDEFQDTNRLQCEIVDLLADGPDGKELFFVGDEFQSIYRFRHADVEVFRERRERSGGVLALTQNYRSRPEVLAAVNHLFSSEFGDEFQPLEAAGRFPDPVFGAPVELLVTDKSTLRRHADSLAARRGAAHRGARAAARRLGRGDAPARSSSSSPPAPTPSTTRKSCARRACRTYRATGRGYFGQQQVVDLLAYLRLLHNRYDDEALVTVLASPFVGLSNDALVLLRSAATRRPLFQPFERGLPADLSERGPPPLPRLPPALRAARRRRRRGSRSSSSASGSWPTTTTTSPCSPRWDGRRRYANMRKLARLARSYEELRGRDIEGFVRFVREQEAVGARELEAVAEEEDGDAVRLLTIHSAKGLEFKVVIVADAGRDRNAPSPDEILCLPDGRFGFRVADPATGSRRPAFEYERVREAEREAERAERLRLYYVAMTRAIDRLIVSGAIDPGRTADAGTPIGWVLSRLEAQELDAAGDGPVELVRDGARLLVRVDRYAPTEASTAAAPAVAAAEEGQLELFVGEELAPLPPLAPRLPELAPVPAPPLHRVRRLSYSALALFERCSYRYYAERIAGMRAEDAHGSVPGQTGLAATEIGDAVHRLLETVDMSGARGARPRARPRLVSGGHRRGARADPRLRRVVLRLGAGAADRLAAGRGARAAVRVRARRRAPPRPARRLLERRRAARSSSTTRRTRWPRARPRRSSRATTSCSGSSTRSRACGPGPRRSRSSTTSSSVRTPSSRPASRWRTRRRSRPSSRRRSRASTRASFVRRRASSTAPAARRATGSARARACSAPNRRTSTPRRTTSR